MDEHFADRLLGAIEAKGSPVCVGLDPVYERLPAELVHPDARCPAAGRVERLGAFCRAVLDVVAPIVPAVKPQIARFEVYGHLGVALYSDVVRYARELGLVVIGDVKRGDIGSTAEAYAAAHLLADASPDAVTVNGYFGSDGLRPFIDAAAGRGRGVFVLVRTSNPSATDVQDFTDASGRTFYEHMAEQVSSAGAEAPIGRCGYSCLGAVVGATYPDEARRLRQIMPQQIFLVPGYGAQGATAADCAAAFKDDGTGALVNASRSVIFAYTRDGCARADWKQAVADAAQALARDIAEALRP